jgi:hypothetical protein
LVTHTALAEIKQQEFAHCQRRFAPQFILYIYFIFSLKILRHCITFWNCINVCME